MINKDDLCDWLAGNLSDPEKVRIIDEEYRKEGPNQVRAWLEDVKKHSKYVQNMVNSGELSRRLAGRRRSRACDQPAESWEEKTSHREDHGRGG